LAIQKRITDANVPFEAGDGLVYVTAAEHRYNTCTARRGVSLLGSDAVDLRGSLPAVRKDTAPARSGVPLQQGKLTAVRTGLC